VIDAQQQDYESACVRLRDLIKQTSELKQNIVYEVFIHKVDGDLFLSEDERVAGRQALRAALSAPAGAAETFVSRHGGESGIRWSMLPLTDAEGQVDALLLAGERADPVPVSEPAVETIQEAAPQAATDDTRAAQRHGKRFYRGCGAAAKRLWPPL
jgi:hypothetical protein